MKAIKVEKCSENLEIYRCPVCKRYVTIDEHIYCPKCGQLLDWSETEAGKEQNNENN